MELIEELKRAYPDATCELEYNTEFELLISVILSAQCTDKRVNAVTKEMFKVANTPEQFCEMPIEELEEHIKSCGLYKNKAANIKSCCRDLVDKFGGRVPDTMEQLITLAGVGRKTANVMLSVAFGKPAIAVDTHVFRVAHRIGLSSGKTPNDVERDLNKAFREEDYRDAHFLLIRHGRDCCHARKPDCEICPIKTLCATGINDAEVAANR
ncbi:MAG: endonuclease III [Clostridiales bacterium]|nr:endonuclease III [Clostridiales bacterium]